MNRPIKRFKKFIKEEQFQNYTIQFDPYADEDDIRDAFSEMFAFCTFQSQRGNFVLLTARPIADTNGDA